MTKLSELRQLAELQILCGSDRWPASDVLKLLDLVDDLKEALEFYSKDEHYYENSLCLCCPDNVEESEVDKDEHGERARQALARMKEWENG
jgi:hypothetical protein